MDSQLTGFWVHVLPSWLLCDSGFRYDQTEIHLWTCKRYLTFGCAFVFTRSEKNVLWTKKKLHISCCFKRKWIIALLCFTYSNANPNLKCIWSRMFTFESFPYLNSEKISCSVFPLHGLSGLRSSFNIALAPNTKSTIWPGFNSWIKNFWVLSLRALNL